MQMIPQRARGVTVWFDEYENDVNYMRCVHSYHISVGDLDRCVRQQSPPPSSKCIYIKYIQRSTDAILGNLHIYNSITIICNSI